MRLLPATKSTFGKQLQPRVAMLKNLVSSVIMKEQVVTTRARALAARPIVEMVIRNARDNKPDLRQEVEEWTVNHDKVMPLLYGPLRVRYNDRPGSLLHTRVFNLGHRGYRHADMAVLELVDGPRDTLRNLDRFSGELNKLKAENKDMLFTRPVSELMMNVRTSRRGKMHEMHKRKSIGEFIKNRTLVEAGKEKCRHIMTLFAKKAIGEPLSIQHQPEFWVK